VKKTILCVAVAVALALAATAQAQVKAEQVSISPFIGGYTFENNENLKTSLVYGLRAGFNWTKHLGFEGYFLYAPTKNNELASEPRVDLFGYGVEGLYHFMPDSRLVPFVAVGLGGNRYSGHDGLSDRNLFTLDYGAGLKYFLTENVALRADVRHVLPFNDHYNELLYSVGVTFAFGGAKKAMPEIQATRAAEPAAPAQVVRDSDGDGVVDDLDKCPNTPSGVKVDQDGCPLDTDKDGVYDYLDKCPGTPAGVKVDQDGCPLDTDKDGVYDYLDKCPGTPAGVKVDSDGCPYPAPAPPPAPAPAPAPVAKPAPTAMEKAITEKGRVTLNVEFDTAKSTIRPTEQQDITKLAEVMKKYPDLKIQIEGHTDNVGSAKYNEKLSQQRADAVKKNLVEKYGIEASRLTAKGFGLTKPIASNATKEGRQKNRRVEAAAEFIIKK
jgi:OOP family OmpA-OmpF porin